MLLSIIIPLYNEEHIIPELYSRTTAALNAITPSWEVICVNDGSTDATLGLLLEKHAAEPRWKVLDLSRNFGQQRAIWAGLNYTGGEFVGIMDADLQDAPEHFSSFYQELQQGCDVVYAVRTNRKENPWKRMAYWTFYRLLRNIFRVNLPIDSGDFCLMRRAVVRHMLTMPEQSLFVRGIRNWVGFRQKGLRCERDARHAGRPKYALRDLMKLAYNGIFSFSDFPLRFLGRLGLYIIIGSIIYAGWILTKKFLWGTVPEGFTTTILVILFFGGVQLVTVRILGEYIQRIYDESRRRPLFIVRDSAGWPGKDPT